MLYNIEQLERELFDNVPIIVTKTIDGNVLRFVHKGWLSLDKNKEALNTIWHSLVIVSQFSIITGDPDLADYFMVLVIKNVPITFNKRMTYNGIKNYTYWNNKSRHLSTKYICIYNQWVAENNNVFYLNPRAVYPIKSIIRKVMEVNDAEQVFPYIDLV
jgi:hypothetical protein